MDHTIMTSTRGERVLKLGMNNNNYNKIPENKVA
jgi:hypothetical protein